MIDKKFLQKIFAQKMNSNAATCLNNRKQTQRNEVYNEELHRGRKNYVSDF